ncbi:protein of unknown function [Streptomyces sp. KY75]|nr:protein of unknown function [Streptomyces sp. KY75]CAD5994706.1 protein of unknown function [Streptomyces sp. KY70]
MLPLLRAQGLTAGALLPGPDVYRSRTAARAGAGRLRGPHQYGRDRRRDRPRQPVGRAGAQRRWAPTP